MRHSFAIIIFLGMALGFEAQGFGYSYGPACQWVHLVGEVDLPQGEEIKRPISLTVTYQLPGMNHSATLLTNYPLPKDKFKFFLAGFDEEIAGVLFVRPMFFFAKEILFRYYAKSADGRWRSGFHISKYSPAPIPTVDLPKNRDKEFLCHTRVDLEPLVMRRW